MEFKIDHKDQILAKMVNSVWPESKDGWIVTVVPVNGAKRPKTDAQRSAFHVWLRLLAEELNAAGLDQRVVFDAMKEGVERPWTLETCKENLWRPLQEAMLQKSSTEDLEIKQPDEIYSVLHRWLVSKGFPCPPWPNRWDKS